MKKLILAILMLSAGVIFAQSKEHKKEKKEINKVLTAMMDANAEGDMVGALDYTYPKLFEIVPREALESQIKMLSEEAGLLISFENFKLGEIGDIKTFEEYTYAHVTYTVDMTMTYTSEEIDESLIKMTATMLEGQFGEENIEVDYEAKSIKIFNESTMLAIKDDVNDWGLLELKPELASVLSQIIPEEILSSE